MLEKSQKIIIPSCSGVIVKKAARGTINLMQFAKTVSTVGKINKAIEGQPYIFRN